MSQVQEPASSAASRARHAVRLRSPGSHDSVTPWNAVVMPFASNCDSVSRNARSTGKSTPGPRLDLAFERVAVQIDDARQHQQPGRIEPEPATAIADAVDQAVLDGQIRFHQSIRGQQHGSVRDTHQ